MNTLMAEPAITRLSYRVSEIAELTGLTKRQVYRLVESHDLEHFRVGVSVHITAESYERWRSDRLAEARQSA